MVNINAPIRLKNYFLIYSMSNKKVEFLANKMKKSNDRFLLDYSKDGYSYNCFKREIIKTVNNSINSEINTFKKVHGTKFIDLSSNEIYEQKSEPEVARLIMPKLKEKVELKRN